MQIVLLQEIEGEKADELVKKCPAKVFDIEDIGKGKADPNFWAVLFILHIYWYWTVKSVLHILDGS